MVETLVRLKRIYNKLVHTKHSHELRYWKERFALEGGKLQNDFYAKLMLSISDEENDDFLRGKIVGDFGCGPRGSLVWARQASLKIGIDVLATKYLECFPLELISHGVIYVSSSELHIPLPDSICDYVYSVNSLDHVKNLLPMCNELRRVLKPGGEIIGSFNLNHLPSTAEPQRISENILRKMLFRNYEIIHWWVSAPGPVDDLYRPLYERKLIDPAGGEAYLWARARKPL